MLFKCLDGQDPIQLLAEVEQWLRIKTLVEPLVSIAMVRRTLVNMLKCHTEIEIDGSAGCWSGTIV